MQEDGTDFDELVNLELRRFWRTLFGFRIGDLVRHKDWGNVLWRVEDTSGKWIELRRVTEPKKGQIVPYRINILKEKRNGEGEKWLTRTAYRYVEKVEKL